MLYLTDVGPECGDDGLLSGGDTEDQQKHQEHNNHGGVGEGHQGCPEAAQSESMPGQTGQDWPRSTKPGQQIAEAEQSEAEDRPRAPGSRLRAHQRPRDVLHGVKGKGQHAGLHQS